MAEDNWQRKANKFALKYNLHHSPMVHALDLVSEVGEVAKEIIVATEYGRQSAQFNQPDIDYEMGDVLYSLCLLASAAGVDLGEALDASLAKYEERMQKRGHSGSA